MKMRDLRGCLLAIVLILPGCTTNRHRGPDLASGHRAPREPVLRSISPARDREDEILALVPERVTAAQIREVLSNCPAPRIINIHGGLFPIHTRMISFSKFLVGMGYPELSITNPADGAYAFSCYESCERLAGMLAWYYEKEGLRPMMVGHSQGGMQVVKVLHRLAGDRATSLSVWNPLTREPEARCVITDPLTGNVRPVVGLQLPYATVVGSGGLGRLLPNQWELGSQLRTIPDSVEEFTRFYKHMDLLGGDLLGYGSANLSKAGGRATVRNVQLPWWYRHGSIPDTKHLLESQQVIAWINDYDPADPPSSVPDFGVDTRNILWAADVWHSIKKHWVLELQRSIRARRAAIHVH